MAEGKVEAGGAYYAISHVYHHFIFEVVEMLGPQRARCKNVRRIHACSRGWDAFFRDGAKTDTTFMVFPDGELTWFNIFDWVHEVPGVKQ